MIDFFFFVFFYLQLIARILDFFILKIFVFSWYLFQTTYLVDLSFHNSILSVTSSTKISCLFTYFIYPTSCPCTEFYKKKKTKQRQSINVLLLLFSSIILLSLLLSIHDVGRRLPLFCLFNKKGFFSIGGNKDFIGVAI